MAAKELPRPSLAAYMTPAAITATVAPVHARALSRSNARATFHWSAMARVALAVAAIVAAVLLDPWAFHHLVMPRVYEEDWGRALRIAGFLPTWMIVSTALVLCAGFSVGEHVTGSAHTVRGDPRRAPGRPPWLYCAMPVLAAIAAGIVGELLKLVIRRERPMAHAGAYVFRSWSVHTFSTGGLSTPSSHAVVAFGAAAMLARLYPRAAWLWYALAAGCALTRVLARAHFLSDVTLSAIVAWVVVAVMWKWYAGREDVVATRVA